MVKPTAEQPRRRASSTPAVIAGRTLVRHAQIGAVEDLAFDRREEFLAGTHTPAAELFDPVASTVFAGAAAR